MTPSTFPTVGGTAITISAQTTAINLGTSGSVTIGGNPCQVTSWSGTQVVCTTPSGAGANSLIVTYNGGYKTAPFTVHYSAPSIMSVSPLSLPTAGGTAVTLTGTDFGPSTAQVSVSIDGNDCPVTSHDQTSIVCTAPAGTGAARALVATVARQASNSFSIDYLPPSVTSVTPASGLAVAGGTAITLSGLNFGPASAPASVSVGGNDCPITSHSQTSIVCTAPAGEHLSVPVRVTVAGQTSADGPVVSYAPPTITSISGAGPTSGGNTLVLGGTNFCPDSLVTVGGNSCPLAIGQQQTSTSLSCVVPAGEGTSLDVQVWCGVQSSNIVSYSYDPPSITSVSPGHGPTIGGTSITVSGSSFGFSSSVTVGGNPCLATAQSHTSLVCTTPAGQGRNQPVVLTNLSRSATSPSAFNYDPPQITGISPSVGLASGGTVLTISGSNFGTSGTVTVGGSNCTPTAGGFSHSTISCLLPAGTAGTTVLVSVTVSGQPSNSVSFTYAQAQITSISPVTGPTAGGIELDLAGTGFGTTGASVTVGSASCSLLSQSDTLIKCTLPAGTGANQPVVVTIAGKSSNTVFFSYGAPTITSIYPVSGPTAGGSLLQLSGNNFGSAGATVTINQQPCPVQGPQSNNSLSCLLPAGVGTNVPVAVTVGGQTSVSPVSFSYLAPSITGVSPASAPSAGGTPLTITGQNFGAQPPTVTVNRVSCPVTVNAQNSVTCTIPSGTGTHLDVSVVVAGQVATAPGAFSYQPQILSVTPVTGPTTGGTTLVLSGTSFDPSSAAVMIGSLPCLVTQQSAQLVTCTVPAGVGANLPIVLTTNSLQATASSTFSYAAPHITGITPANGPSAGGLSLTLTGSGFGATGATVKVGGVTCPATQQSESSITCTLPAGTGSKLDVVATAGGQTGTLTGGFSYDPVITSLSPATGPTAGGIDLTIQGTSLGRSGTLVTVGEASCPVTSQSDTSVVCTLPAGVGTDVPVVLTAGTLSATSTTFNYAAPQILTLLPSFGPASGGVPLTIVGSNFGPAGTATVLVGSTPCPVTTQTDGSLICTLPAGTGSNLTVSVTTGGQTAVDVGAFSYDGAVTGIQPPTGPTAGNIPITLTGVNFGMAGAHVTIGGESCPVTAQTDTSLTCTLPAGQGTQLGVEVLLGAQIVNGGTFSYDPPLISTLTPAHGPAAGHITLALDGQNFGTAALVTVDGAVCPTQLQNQTHIECSLPAGLGRSRKVIVTVAGQSSPPASFDTDPPVVTALSSTTGPTTGGVPLTLTGLNFGASGASVSIGTNACPVTLQNDTTITCTLPAGTGSNLPVTVTAGGQTSTVVPFSYSLQAPIAQSDSMTMDENSTQSISLQATDPQGAALTFELVAQPPPGQGSVVLSGAQATYTPPMGFFGTTSFSFRASNGQLDSNTAQIVVTVKQLPTRPTATAATITTQQNVPAVVFLQGSSAMGSPLTYAIAQQPDPSTGTVTLSGAQATFQPAQNFVGTTSFSFTVSDGDLTSDPAQVQINVVENATPPVAQALQATTPEDTGIGLGLQGSDANGAPLTFRIVQAPQMAQGTVTLAGSLATFTPALHFKGDATFQYVANDGATDSAPATVTITVTPVNHAPVADGQVLQTALQAPLVITLTANDPDGDALTYSISTPPPASTGTVTLTGATATFTPTANFVGTTSFTFTASDGTLSGNATVAITVSEPSTPLTFVSPTPQEPITVAAGATVKFQAAAQGTGHIVYSVAGLPTGATFDGTTGAFSWATKEADAGSHAFVLQATNGVQVSSQTVTVIVNGAKNIAGCESAGSAGAPLLGLMVGLRWLFRRRK